ncbi:hypothetical protein HK096_004524, partial [Nowakowskiella sp. JEL0078]
MSVEVPRRSARISKNDQAVNAKVEKKLTSKKLTKSYSDESDITPKEKKAAKRAQAVEGDTEFAQEKALKKAKTESDILKVGDSIPDVELLNEIGERVRLHDLAAETGIVLFSYPKANTP